jgi:arylsulfatase A-like enzyme
MKTRFRTFRLRSESLTLCLSIVLAIVLVTCAGTPAKPNIVFILVDDLGWKDVGFMGSQYYETPNIDRLARDGMTFTSAYANAPNCAPTRASLMTGLYTPRHGIYTVGSAERGKSQHRVLIPIRNTTVLDTSFVTLAEILKRDGYVTAHIGKWHLGSGPESGPEQQGFDLNIAGNQSGHPRSYFSPYRNPELADGQDGEYLTDRLTDEALKFIAANRRKPFFLYLPHYAVHTPIAAKPEIVAKFADKPGSNQQSDPAYAAMIASTDAGVGRIMNRLAELDLTDNTVIIFFSDNGGHGNYTSMHPLRGSKGMLYEGGIREPMIVAWPGRIRAGSLCHTPVIGLDFFPTVIELAGIVKPHRLTLDGESLMPLLLEQGSLQRQALFWHFPAYLEAYNRNQGTWRMTPAGAIRHGDWKLIEFFEDGRLELYNLENDIGESEDISQSYPEKTKSLYQELVSWRQRVQAPVPTVANPDYRSREASP